MFTVVPQSEEAGSSQTGPVWMLGRIHASLYVAIPSTFNNSHGKGEIPLLIYTSECISHDSSVFECLCIPNPYQQDTAVKVCQILTKAATTDLFIYFNGE